MTRKRSLLVRKRPLVDAGPVPAVQCEVLGDLARPARVRLTESLPVDVDRVDLGFLGGTDGWSVAGRDTVVYEGVVQQGYPCRTGYAVATTERKLRRAFMDRPTVELREPESDGSGTWERVEDASFRVVEDLATMAVA